MPTRQLENGWKDAHKPARPPGGSNEFLTSTTTEEHNIVLVCRERKRRPDRATKLDINVQNHGNVKSRSAAGCFLT